MVNCLRTLLLNELPDSSAAHEEFIPPDFQPLPLSFDTAAVRTLLLGSNFPRDYRNFIATLLTGLAYDSPFASLLDALDPRGTIDFSANQAASLQDTIALDRQLNASSLQVVGTFQAKPATGSFGASWQLRRSASDKVEVLDLGTASTQQVTVTFTGDTTGFYSLDETDSLKFQFVGVGSLPDFRAVMTAQTPMQYDVLAALARVRASDDVAAVFVSPRSSDVLQQMRQAFQNSRRPDHALAALLVAYCYRQSES